MMRRAKPGTSFAGLAKYSPIYYCTVTSRTQFPYFYFFSGAIDTFLAQPSFMISLSRNGGLYDDAVARACGCVVL